MLETPLTNRIKNALTKHGAYTVNIHGSKYSAKGTPDLLVCHNGRYIGMEVKTPDKKNTATRAQRQHLQLIKDAGGNADVVTSVADALALLNTNEGERT